MLSVVYTGHLSENEKSFLFTESLLNTDEINVSSIPEQSFEQNMSDVSFSQPLYNEAANKENKETILKGKQLLSPTVINTRFENNHLSLEPSLSDLTFPDKSPNKENAPPASETPTKPIIVLPSLKNSSPFHPSPELKLALPIATPKTGKLIFILF